VRTVYGDKEPNSVNRQDWVKVHLMCGVKTNIVTSVEITHAHAGDSPQFPALFQATAENFTVKSVAADKAYSSSRNLYLVTERSAKPYIPFRSNAKGNSPTSTSVWRRAFHYYECNRDEFMRHYHKRSNVETTFSMIKAKFGERVRSKGSAAQVNEVLCKVLAHNICCLIASIYELGVMPEFWAD
jgi:hypothetical protein